MSITRQYEHGNVSICIRLSFEEASVLRRLGQNIGGQSAAFRSILASQLTTFRRPNGADDETFRRAIIYRALSVGASWSQLRLLGLEVIRESLGFPDATEDDAEQIREIALAEYKKHKPEHL